MEPALIRVACSPGERRVAVTQADRLLDYAIDRPGAPDGVGDVHVGRLTAKRPAMAGAFVTLGDGGSGFLPDSAGAAGATEGDWLTVRIVRAAQAGKGPRLARLPLPAVGPPRLLRRGPDAVARMAERYPKAPIDVDDAAVWAELRHFDARVRRVPAAFDEHTRADVDALTRATATLPGRASMTVTPTPALVAIDVDLSSGVSGRGSKSLTHMDANLAILPALARAIRLRNLSGAIVVDLAGLSPRRRAALGPAFAAAVADDPVPTRFLGFSALGLAELLRERAHPPLHELLSGPHAAGLRALRWLAYDIDIDLRTPPELRCAADVAEAIERDAVARADIARRAGRPLVVHVDLRLPPGTYLD